MALRDQLREKAQPYLEPGETIQAVISGLRGFDPRLVLLLFPIALAFALADWELTPMMLTLAALLQRCDIVATDRAILVLRVTRMGAVIDVTRLPRSTRLGPVSGLWTKVQLDQERVYIPWRFRDDAAVADAAITSAPASIGEAWPARTASLVSLRRRRR